MTHPVRNPNNSENTSDYHSLLEHFSELRQRIVTILVCFVISVVIVYISSFWWMTSFISYITRAHVVLHAFSFTEMIQIYVMVIFFIALCLVSPVIFYQLWSFVSPGLHHHERHFIYKYSIFSALLFIVGVVFAFYIGFPLIINFSLKLSATLHIDPVIGFKAYLGELIRWLLVFGVLFQLPILFMGLAKFGLIDAHALKHYRKYIYFACFVTASIIAPPDLTLNILLTLPLILLFEFSMLIVKITYRQ
ncbi:twin-arginine translocase subunit TatC [Staphylococcus simiae]|uniref:twin-arginine translocase subunit TatC n=1 Tax=Staphylococcus simiae TaxID=308354 RepID=UPI001A96CFAA|nr:twin-arginine translocase subunit TatC [Staphylococcus simiae]MBO1198703.1 twin-arginine translocase subunit TatC [Staphylococcus simiae]MBO1200955.1 twin-arginine translocase subunit TatC [Staphylococcus simiae]MBO1203200.1 twin-arginine translocase subunit TatC [Staphylococcus simiae]MBO1210692.1 twin-arginine translocase subunit TatC [Staphylococcus simiae]MBO1229293.1 twin-arginine translocase subunit TatC [Staphylococcus simiae]